MMGFSSQKYQKDQKERPWKINPVWRGIGCILILLIPIMSWLGAQIFIASNTIALPPDLTKTVSIRYFKVAEVDRIIADFNHFTAANGLITGQFFFTVIFMFIGFGVLSFIYAVLYRMIGPPRYGPFDIPPSSMRR